MYQFYYIQFSLLQEFRWFHHEGKKPRCEICDNFFSKSWQSQNLRIFCSVHGGKKPYKCKICSKFSFLKGKLNRHIVFIHDGKYPYKFEICDKFFQTKDNLVKHITSVHFLSSKRQLKRIQVISPWRKNLTMWDLWQNLFLNYVNLKSFLLFALFMKERRH